MSQNNVIFKGKNDGLIIILNNKVSFEELKASLEQKVSKAAKFFQGANISITFKGRSISDSEEMELLDIISEGSGLSISFVHSKGEKPIFVRQQKLSKIESDDIDKNNISEEIITKEDINKENAIKENISKKNSIKKNIMTAYENITSFHKGSIRSGQSIKFKGSIIIIGDVNPGGEVIAEGNVVVLGSVKGLVHAGCKGLSDCFIVALKLNPTQLRIADIITFFPEIKKDKFVPKCAFAKNGEIYVEPLMNL